MVDQGKCESLRVYTPTSQHPCYNAVGKSSCRQNHSFKDISIILRTDSPSQAGSIFFVKTDNHGGGQVQISNPLQLHFTVHAHWIIIYIQSSFLYIYIMMMIGSRWDIFKEGPSATHLLMTLE